MNKLTDEGLALLKELEGLRLVAYQDQRGIWTIGYGHTRNVKEGMRITEKEADRLLAEDLDIAVRAIRRLVKQPMTDNQFSAYVSLVHNIGVSAFEGSTTLRLFNRGDIAGAADAILLWNKLTINGKKKVSKGQTTRRRKEKALFLKV
jgi:lysozyme